MKYYIMDIAALMHVRRYFLHRCFYIVVSRLRAPLGALLSKSVYSVTLLLTASSFLQLSTCVAFVEYITFAFSDRLI